MNLQEILNKVDKFNVNDHTDEYEISKFFNEIGENFSELGELKNSGRKLSIQSFFNFLKRQSPQLDENFSFIHLIEWIDNDDYKIYSDELMRFNRENPTVTSILLLNRYINSLEGQKRQLTINLLKEISENAEILKIRREAQRFFDYQIEKNN